MVRDCRFAQAPRTTVPLCFNHAALFKRSEVYRRWQEYEKAGELARQARALADWLDHLENH